MGNANIRKTERVISFINDRSSIRAPDKKTRILIEEIKGLLADPGFDNNRIMAHILNKICLITGAEYGCICKIEYDDDKPKIYRYAATNIAWDDASMIQYRSTLENPFKAVEACNEILGRAVATCRSIIDNDYDDTQVVSPGHPGIKRYMSVPCLLGHGGNRPPFTIYVCNKLEEFNKRDAVHAESVLNAVSHLFK